MISISVNPQFSGIGYEAIWRIGLILITFLTLLAICRDHIVSPANPFEEFRVQAYHSSPKLKLDIQESAFEIFCFETSRYQPIWELQALARYEVFGSNVTVHRIFHFIVTGASISAFLILLRISGARWPIILLALQIIAISPASEAICAVEAPDGDAMVWTLLGVGLLIYGACRKKFYAIILGLFPLMMASFVKETFFVVYAVSCLTLLIYILLFPNVRQTLTHGQLLSVAAFAFVLGIAQAIPIGLATLTGGLEFYEGISKTSPEKQFLANLRTIGAQFVILLPLTASLFKKLFDGKLVTGAGLFNVYIHLLLIALAVLFAYLYKDIGISGRYWAPLNLAFCLGAVYGFTEHRDFRSFRITALCVVPILIILAWNFRTVNASLQWVAGQSSAYHETLEYLADSKFEQVCIHWSSVWDNHFFMSAFYNLRRLGYTEEVLRSREINKMNCSVILFQGAPGSKLTEDGANIIRFQSTWTTFSFRQFKMITSTADYYSVILLAENHSRIWNDSSRSFSPEPDGPSVSSAAPASISSRLSP